MPFTFCYYYRYVQGSYIWFFDTLAADFYRVWLERNGYEREGQFLKIAQAIDGGLIKLPEYYQQLAAASSQSARAIQQEFERETAIDHDMFAFIHQLHGKYTIGLLTNSPQGLVRIILQRHNLEQYFDDIVISGEVKLVKPDPKIFELAGRKMNVLATEAIFIDDLSECLHGAEQIGMTTILFQGLDKLKANLEALGVIP